MPLNLGLNGHGLSEASGLKPQLGWSERTKPNATNRPSGQTDQTGLKKAVASWADCSARAPVVDKAYLSWQHT
jgi:hypothetical protein